MDKAVVLKEGEGLGEGRRDVDAFGQGEGAAGDSLALQCHGAIVVGRYVLPAGALGVGQGHEIGHFGSVFADVEDVEQADVGSLCGMCSEDAGIEVDGALFAFEADAVFRGGDVFDGEICARCIPDEPDAPIGAAANQFDELEFRK